MKPAVCHLPARRGAGVARGQPAASVWDGVYTEEQAERGQALYAKDAPSCHGAALTGGEDGASARRLRRSWPTGTA